MRFVVKGIGDYALEADGVPSMGEGESIVRVKACGICGSDLPRLFMGKVYHYPLVIGHEFAGVIEDSHDRTKIGKKVCVFPIKPCFSCENCRNGNYANCDHYDYYGSRCDGGMQDYVVCRDFNLIELPDGIRYGSAAMIEPCAVTLHAMKKADVRGRAVRVYGAGTIGLLCCMWAKDMGAKEVTVSDIDPRKSDFAEKLGLGAQGKEAPDVVIEASGAGSALNDALEVIRPFGRVVLVGNASRDVVLPVGSFSRILRKQLSLVGSWNSDYKQDANDWKDSVDAIAAGRICPELLITHRYPLKDMMSAIAMIQAKQEMFNKIMVEM